MTLAFIWFPYVLSSISHLTVSFYHQFLIAPSFTILLPPDYFIIYYLYLYLIDFLSFIIHVSIGFTFNHLFLIWFYFNFIFFRQLFLIFLLSRLAHCRGFFSSLSFSLFCYPLNLFIVSSTSLTLFLDFISNKSQFIIKQNIQSWS